MNKKAQIEAIQSLIIPLVGIAIVLVIGFLIMDGMKDQAIDIADTYSGTNTTFTHTLDSFVVLNYSCITENDATVTNVYNSTGNPADLIASGNYTIVGREINLSDDGLGGIASINNTIFVSYSCTQHSSAINGTRKTQGALDDIPGWLPIIVITIIGSILIGLVSVFRRR